MRDTSYFITVLNFHNSIELLNVIHANNENLHVFHAILAIVHAVHVIHANNENLHVFHAILAIVHAVHAMVNAIHAINAIHACF